MMNTEQLCNHIIHLIHMPVRVYTEEGILEKVYIDHGEQQDVLDCDGGLLKLLLEKGRKDYPALYLEAGQIIYGIVKGGGKVYISGPCCISRAETEAAHYLIKIHHMDSQKPYRISRTSLDIFCETVMMLYEMVTDRVISKEELLQKNFCDEELLASMHKKMHKVFYDLQESSAVHNPYSQEVREQEAIRKGDIEALNKSMEESYVGKLGTLSPDPLRNTKNLIIVVITLACRSAIAGGLLPEVAFTMSDAFIQHLEEMSDIAEIYVFGRQAEIEYCQAVHNLAFKAKQNPLIERCKGMVVSRLHSKLSVKDIAGELEITPGYLSHLFLQEEGMKLTDYIIREKIEASKKELVYTEKSLDAVAYAFGFVSQSHFGQAFKKWAGMTPKSYRENYGIKQKIQENYRSYKKIKQ